MSKKVLVGLSGGVDSSVCVAILKTQGFEVCGVYIKGWYPDWKECSWKENRRDAMRVCAKLDIPFKTLDLSKEYKREVVDYFLKEYQKGRTPNPDVMCNREIKFGGFYDYALENNFDYIATGHYARIQDGRLMRGVDKDKDQSYFLWSLKKEQLGNILFPLGSMEKSKVRKLAKKYDLVTKDKKDSQGICFLEDISMEDFLKHYFPAEVGDVLNEKDEVIGSHEGAILYTIGQRHGFKTNIKSIDEKPYFVISKDLEKNTITVSTKRPESDIGDVLELGSVNWITQPNKNKGYLAQSRYRQKPYKCHINENKVVIDQSSDKPVSGQSLVVYDGDVCLGGGMI